MQSEDINVLNKQYRSPIKFMGKTRELSKTTKRVSNEIIFLLKKEAKISTIPDPEKYKEEIDKWMEDVTALVKSLISPISDEELRFIEEDDLVDIIDAIERRKRKARGFSDDDIDALEQAGKKAMIDNAKMIIGESEVVEDFPQTQNMDLDTNIGKQNTSEN